MTKRTKAAFKAAITVRLNRQIRGLHPVKKSRTIAAFKAAATVAKNRL